MICYKDMTFCPFYKTCNKGQTCDRALTQEVKSKAEKWMKDALISIYMDQPECYQPILNEKPFQI